MTHDSNQFYTILQSTFREAEEAILKSGYDERVGFAIYAGSYWNRSGGIEINISSSSSEKVTGKDLWACIDEFLRRVGFERSQALLQLGAPQVDQEEIER